MWNIRVSSTLLILASIYGLFCVALPLKLPDQDVLEQEEKNCSMETCPEDESRKIDSARFSKICLVYVSATLICFASFVCLWHAGHKLRKCIKQVILHREKTLSTPHQCSISLDDAQLAVKTNCEHVFCAQCLLQVLRQTSQPITIPCPNCRQRVTLMVPYFTKEEYNAVDPALAGDRARVVEGMKAYSRRNEGKPSEFLNWCIFFMAAKLSFLAAEIYTGIVL